MEKSKVPSPKLRVMPHITPEMESVLELITPTARTFMCRRTGHLVDGGFCAFFCQLGEEQEVRFDPSEGIDVDCPFAYNEFHAGMDDGAVAES